MAGTAASFLNASLYDKEECISEGKSLLQRRDESSQGSLTGGWRIDCSYHTRSAVRALSAVVPDRSLSGNLDGPCWELCCVGSDWDKARVEPDGADGCILEELAWSCERGLGDCAWKKHGL